MSEKIDTQKATPPPPKGSIDETPKFLLRQHLGPRGDMDPKLGKTEMGFGATFHVN